MPLVVIIGAGITGLAAAHHLNELNKDNKHSLKILLLEARDRAGGVIRTYQRDGYILEAGPDIFISEKPEALELAKRINIETRLIGTDPTNRRSFIALKGKLHSVPEGFHLMAPSRLWPFITSDIFSWSGKVRMAFDLILPKRVINPNSNDDETLAQFVRRRLGNEALVRMAQPMVGGIYTADPELLSLRATMPRFLDMEQKYRSLILALWKSRDKENEELQKGTSGARYSLFLSFDKGMQTLVDQLVSLLHENSLKLNTKVISMKLNNETNKWRITCEPDETIDADAVCLALPAYASAKLLRDFDSILADELNSIPYASTATINLAYKRDQINHPLNGFGFVVPAIEKRTILACSFSSVKFKGRAPEGHALLRAFVGGAMQPEMFDLDEELMIDAVRKDLKDLLGIKTAPLFTLVEKWPKSMAQYHVGHLSRIDRIRERLRHVPTLQLAGNAYNGAGIPDCIRSGTNAAEEIFQYLNERFESY
jgi:protoporphyrinogen/coproporphyrinogen III oxidase